MLVRMLLFSEARFQFRQIRNGRPGDLFGTRSSSCSRRRGSNGTTGDLLTRMMQDSTWPATSTRGGSGRRCSGCGRTG
jgi:hypothetical protein